MIREVVIPVFDQTTTEVILVNWLANEGDEVSKGDIILEVETDKATVEIETDASGVLRKILIQPDTTIPPKTVVALIGDPDEPLPDIDPFYRIKSTEQEPPSLKSAGISEDQVVSSTSHGEYAQKIIASPRAKRIAEKHELDLAIIQGTGPRGRIVESDVRQALEQKNVPKSLGISRATADRVTRSWQNIPHFYTTITIDLSSVVNKKESSKINATYTDYFALAIAKALKKYPSLNGEWKNNAPEIRSEIHLGILVQTDRGLLLPVIRNIHKLDLYQISESREQLVKQTHAGKLSAKAMNGATFTLSNLGSGNIDIFTAIISPPQLAILSVGSILPRPLVVGNELMIRPTAFFTLGADHRAIDGRAAAAFLEELKSFLEEH